jgi:hypothetical protein
MVIVYFSKKRDVFVEPYSELTTLRAGDPYMNFYSAILGLLIAAHTTLAEPFFDQIGPMDGSGVGSQGYLSQEFSPPFGLYNIVAAENITIGNTATINTVDVILRGWVGFIDPSSVTNYQLNFYSSPEAAGSTLVGDVLSIDVDPANATTVPQWQGGGFLVSIETDFTIETGEYYFGVICANQFPNYGQVGIGESLIGDDISAYWANPANGFGSGTEGEIPFELAYRLSNSVPIDPCLDDLSSCATDLDGDGIITVNDLLSIIDHWGECGDGSYRPVGDISPAPAGDCCVDVNDLLRIIGEWAWVYDCTPTGACCFNTGVCTDEMREDDCQTQGGLFLGEDSLCLFEDCGIGACCLSETECTDNMTTWDCENVGGVYRGNDSLCETVICMLAGDECDDPVQVYEGANPFDTSMMTPSEPEPSDFGNDNGWSWNCFSSNFEWNNSSDGWYLYVATSAGPTTFSTCDSDSYDTSIALYAGGCYPSDQVRCNGDSDLDETGCQVFFSSIEYNVTIGESYFIRIGSWNGEHVGIGTLTITPPPTGDGVCCFFGDCVTEWDSATCLALGGTFIVGETCDTPDLCLEPEPPANDHCSTAEELFLGQTPFDTTLATASALQTDDQDCLNLNWCGFNDFGEWICSPDIWYSFLAPNDATYRFSTCDPESYDTSIVLYQGNCSDAQSQVACNGDGTAETGCQPFYSSLEYDVISGETYYLRVGGWKAATGTGTISILPAGVDTLGGCCVLGECVGEMSETDCQALMGSWITDTFCVDIVCEEPLCPDATVSQSPFTSGDPLWRVRTSADDPTNGYYFESAANVQVDAMNSFTVWGFEAINVGGWQTCNNLSSFKVTTFEDDGTGLPGAVVDQQATITPVRTPTGELFAGVYELIQYDFNFPTTAFDHISVQSNSDGLDCWFLWMCSPNGDGTSSTNYGDGWFQLDPGQIDDLSICID